MKELRDEVDVPPGEDAADVVWRHVSERMFFDKKGYRANMNRFHSVITEGAKLLRKASMAPFQTQYLCTEMDFVDEAGLELPDAGSASRP